MSTQLDSSDLLLAKASASTSKYAFFDELAVGKSCFFVAKTINVKAMRVRAKQKSRHGKRFVVVCKDGVCEVGRLS